jgi:hypothetical protein
MNAKAPLLLAVFSLGLAAQSVLAQTPPITNYTTGNFTTGNGWSNSGDPLWQGQQGWTGTGSGADSVSVVGGITPGTPTGSASGTLGIFLPTLPLNTADVYLERAFTPASVSLTNATVSLVAEWSILTFGPNDNDTFTFDLRNTANTASLLQFQMNNVGTAPGFDYLVSTVGGGTQSQFQTTYGALMRMVVDLTDTTYSGSYSLIDATTRTNIASFELKSGTLAGGLNAYDFGVLRVGWDLASGDASTPGDLGLVVNDLTVVSVPEPSTLALLAVAGLGVGLFVRRRARR